MNILVPDKNDDEGNLLLAHGVIIGALDDLKERVVEMVANRAPQLALSDWIVPAKFRNSNRGYTYNERYLYKMFSVLGGESV